MGQLCLLVAACLSGALLVLGQSPDVSRIIACGELVEDPCRIAKGCTFCRSKWGAGQCFSDQQVPLLPADAFPCRSYNPPNPSTPCDNLPKDQCLSAGSCAWCQSAAVGDACYTAADAQRLPAAIFSCTTGQGSLGAAPAGQPPSTDAAAEAASASPEDAGTAGNAAVSRDAGVKPASSEGAAPEGAAFAVGAQPQQFAFAQQDRLGAALSAGETPVSP